jgi:calcineurin-like phosphoesterase family protein
MSKLFLLSDPHFGHEKMAIRRGFSSAEEQDEFIIKQWNLVVTKRDIVYLLGDITMEKNNYSILDRLNGRKKVILGNHDQGNHVPSLLKHVMSVCGMVKLNGYILTHAPIHPTELGRFGVNIHGHVHENTIDDPRYKNVSCEVLNYTPLLFPTKIKN